MTYVYDIILNFTDNYYYDFYEWNVKDNIINIKKIPLFRVDKNTLNDFINYKIKVNKSLLKQIDNKSIMNKKYKDKYIYIALLSSGEKSIGLCFDKNGNILYKSSMLLDEEEDANIIALNQTITKLKYKKLSKNSINLLRSDIQKKNIIIKELNKIYNNSEYKKLKYIYYDIFNKISDDYCLIYKELINKIDERIQDYGLLFDKLDVK